MEVVAGNRQQALQELSRRLDEEVQRAVDGILVRSNEFDRETSRTYRRERQDWWWRTVTAELQRYAATQEPR